MTLVRRINNYYLAADAILWFGNWLLFLFCATVLGDAYRDGFFTMALLDRNDQREGILSGRKVGNLLLKVVNGSIGNE